MCRMLASISYVLFLSVQDCANLHPRILTQLLYPSIDKKYLILTHSLTGRFNSHPFLNEASTWPSPLSSSKFNRANGKCMSAGDNIHLGNKGDINKGNAIQSSLRRVYSSESINLSRRWSSFIILTKKNKELYFSE